MTIMLFGTREENHVGGDYYNPTNICEVLLTR